MQFYVFGASKLGRNPRRLATASKNITNVTNAL